MVNIVVVGVGFVGLTHAAVTAKFGHNVLGFDVSEDKVKAFSSGKNEEISRYIHEKELSNIVNEELSSGRLKFTSQISDITDSEVFFMCLPTPYKQSGESDLSYLFNASASLLPLLKKNDNFKLIVNKSTVPIGTAEKLRAYLTSNGLTNFDVASNPEFLPEGEAVKHAIHSSKLVIGANNERSFELLRRVYANFYNNPNTTYVETNPETSEAIKYGSNVTLYNQIVMWQEIAAKIAEASPKVNFEKLRSGILADPRIAKWGSYVSAGAGGSCFKKDTLSLAHQLAVLGMDDTYINMIDTINEYHKTYLITRAELEGDYSFNNKSVTILGTAFKQETNDMRESNVLAMVPMLLGKGVDKIKLYDPLALGQARICFDTRNNRNFDRITYHTNVVDALNDSDVAIIATDHQEFRTLKDKLLEAQIRTPYLVIDGRRMMPVFDVKDLLGKGVSYLSIAGTFQKPE